MKQLILIFLATLMLIGCKAKQAVIKETTTSSLIDTTHTVADTMGAVSNYSDTTTATKHVEQSATIEFVDGGGTVSIDMAGNITIQGLKSIKGKGEAAIRGEFSKWVYSGGKKLGGLVKRRAWEADRYFN